MSKLRNQAQSLPLLLSLIVPPLGLILLWKRYNGAFFKKLIGSLGLISISILYLHLFFDLHIEVDGSGIRPVFTFYRSESHYEEIEQSRSQQRGTRVSLEADITSTVKKTDRLTTDSPIQTVETLSTDLSGSYWTNFRGPNRDGSYRERPILTDWPTNGLTLLWRHPIGGGYASFVVAEGRAFTIEQRRQREVVTSYDMETGYEIWSHSWDAEFRESMGGAGPRATPTWDEGRLYALGATGELYCLEAFDGSVVWSRNILTDNGAANLDWGMAVSPLVVGEKLIVLPGGLLGRSIVAYDKLSGEIIWTSLNDKQAYTSPMLVTLAGHEQILVVSAKRAMGLAVENGSLLWDFAWTTSFDINATQPIIADKNHFFISSGYDHGATLVEVRKKGPGFQARAVWQNNRMKNKFNSPVLHQGYVYGLDDGILACLDVRTGERQWKGGRYGYGQLLLASSHLVILTEKGDLVLVKATPERHEETARFSAIQGKTWNNPVLSGGRLLVRNTTEMASFDIRPVSTP